MQVSYSPAPNDKDWTDVLETRKYYTGLETTGGAGISGGFSGAISHPTQADAVEFIGNYAWIRVRLDISRGTLQSVKLNF
jgi:hypothetical protein